ncbi:MAG: phosphatase PAP2 family protein [Magnetococcus sp. DMHC-6]
MILLNWRQRYTYWICHAWLPAGVFLVGLLWFRWYDIDIKLANFFYDFAANRWIYGESWWANTFLHSGGRNGIKLIAILAAVLWVGGYVKANLRPLRRQSGYALLVIGLSTGLVALGKETTGINCPRDLQQYGKDRPYYHLFDSRPVKSLQGKCFPGGHSSGGFSLFFIYYLLKDRRSKRALWGIGFALLIGGLFSFAQLVRGAHFISHDWWSLFICWAMASWLYHVPFQKRLTLTAENPHN